MLLDDVGTRLTFTPINPIFTPILGCRGVICAQTPYKLYIFLFSETRQVI